MVKRIICIGNMPAKLRYTGHLWRDIGFIHAVNIGDSPLITG